jgi:RND family efflux transporter MFP subunit
MASSVDDKSSLLEQLRIDRGAAPVSSRNSSRWWIAGVISVVLLAGGGWLIFARSAGIPVRVAIAQAIAAGDGPGAAAGSGGSLLDASGYVVALRQAAVSGKSVYKVVEVLIEAGQRVKKDEVIARLDDTNNHAAQLQAQAQVKSAEATLAAAKTAYADAAPIYARNKKLVAQGWLSHDAFDASQASYDAARMNLTVAEKQLEVAQGGLRVADRYEDDTVIRAPFDGVVTVKSAQPGEIVSPQFLGGGGVATIVDMDSLEVQVDVSENFISRVHAGQRAMIKLNAYPDWRIPAHVIAVIPTADQSKATVKVRVAFEQRDDRVLPQMGARVSFFEDQPKAVAGSPPPAKAGVIVPAAAIQGSGDVGAVFVIDGDRVERRAVRLGARSADAQTILSGLQPGSHVALGDLATLSDGARVSIQQ